MGFPAPAPESSTRAGPSTGRSLGSSVFDALDCRGPFEDEVVLGEFGLIGVDSDGGETEVVGRVVVLGGRIGILLVDGVLFEGLEAAGA